PESGQISQKKNNLKFRWITSRTFDDENGCVVIKFNDEVLPYLQELEHQFTIYYLQDVVTLRSEHAIRFYEFACQWKNKQKIRLELAWIREKLELQGKYEQPRDMRRFIIEPALKQINAGTPLNLSFEMIKTGRKVTHIELNVHDTKQSLSKRLGL
ncbi:MAG: replication initiation protein, partial [Alteromonadaceae bacterium]|nr:replication initiation protein [Alteromonadaceae bacterium]